MGWHYGENRAYWNTAIAMFLIGATGLTYISIEDAKKFKKLEGKTYREKVESYMEAHRQRQKVLDYVDKDLDGLSFSEDYRIKELMEVEDSSKIYEPTLEDWKRAYKNLK